MDRKEISLENLLVHELFVTFVNSINKIELENTDKDISPALIGMTAAVDVIAYFYAELISTGELDDYELLESIKKDFTTRKNYFLKLIKHNSSIN